MPIAFDPPAPRQFSAFGAGSWIVPPGRVQGAAHIEVGAGVVVMEYSEIRAEPLTTSPGNTPLVHLGDGTRLARFITIWATVGVHIGDKVSSSDYVAIIDCWRQPQAPKGEVPPPDGGKVVIGDGAYLGCGCLIGPGVTVGEGAFIGEGAVVYEDVAPHSVVYGNPARVTRTWTAGDGWRGDMFGRTA
jgi:carbonic anhydrase/acetyltransferase-like protein (isoleucine patch superfamily)